jgi:hypothetical protein
LFRDELTVHRISTAFLNAWSTLSKSGEAMEHPRVSDAVDEGEHIFDRLEDPPSSNADGPIQNQAPPETHPPAGAFPPSESQDFSRIPCSNVDLEVPDAGDHGDIYQAVENEEMLLPRPTKASISNDFCWSVLLALVFCVFFSVIWKRMSHA